MVAAKNRIGRHCLLRLNNIKEIIMDFFKQVGQGFSIAWQSIQMLFSRLGYWAYPLIWLLILGISMTGLIGIAFAVFGPQVSGLLSRFSGVEHPVVRASLSHFELFCTLGFTLFAFFSVFLVSVAFHFYALRVLEGDAVSVGQSFRFSFSRIKFAVQWAVLCCLALGIFSFVSVGLFKVASAVIVAPLLIVVCLALYLFFNFATYFIFPAIVFEEHSFINALKVSHSTAKKSFGVIAGGTAALVVLSIPLCVVPFLAAGTWSLLNLFTALAFAHATGRPTGKYPKITID
jgi:hypothetical protein